MAQRRATVINGKEKDKERLEVERVSDTLQRYLGKDIKTRSGREFASIVTSMSGIGKTKRALMVFEKKMQTYIEEKEKEAIARIVSN